MSTLQQLRDRVRTQLDLDVDDLPDTVVDAYLKEGFDRTYAQEREWPFFEDSWDLTLPSGDTTMALPTAVGGVKRLRSVDTGANLVMIGQQFAEENFQRTSMTTLHPTLFSIWGGLIYLWPVPSPMGRDFTLRGHRRPVWTGVAGDELDGDERLHTAIAHYACSLAYAQLEDPELETMYMQRWAALTDAVRTDIMLPQHHVPLILNGGANQRIFGAYW